MIVIKGSPRTGMLLIQCKSSEMTTELTKYRVIYPQNKLFKFTQRPEYNSHFEPLKLMQENKRLWLFPQTQHVTHLR